MCLVVFIVISCLFLFNKIDICFFFGKVFKVLVKLLYLLILVLFIFIIVLFNLNGDVFLGFLIMIFFNFVLIWSMFLIGIKYLGLFFCKFCV